MRVLLVDDHQILREALATQLSQHPRITTVEQADNAQAALDKSQIEPPDLILMDIEMPGLDPFEAAREIRQIAPQCRVLFLTGHDYDSHVEQAIAAQAAGYVVKRDGMSVLMEAITRVADGGLYFSQTILDRIVVGDDRRLRLSRPRSDAIAALSRRERELLQLLGKGATLKEAAAQMHVSYKTADNQKTSLMRKLDIHDRVELARFAIREGLVAPS